MTTEKDETFTILVKGKPLASVKADLIHAFLSVSFSQQSDQKFSSRILQSRFSDFRLFNFQEPITQLRAHGREIKLQKNKKKLAILTLT